MKELANRLALQHLFNAYVQETGYGQLLEYDLQNSEVRQFSQGQPVWEIGLRCMEVRLYFPLSYVSQVGRHRLADLPFVLVHGEMTQLSPVSIASFMLEDLLSFGPHLDSSSLLQNWIQSREAFIRFLNARQDHLDSLVQFKQDYIEAEQALILGHSMHPAPKSRSGFIGDDWKNFSPELQAKTQMQFWLVAPEAVIEGSALDVPMSQQLKRELRKLIQAQTSDALLNQDEFIIHQHCVKQLEQHPDYKLLPLHPWQARYLSARPWFQYLQQQEKLIDLGQLGWIFASTTSIRTLASFDAPWQLKGSLSVMITNSVRCNQFKECFRGEITCRLWHSLLGQKILKQYPSLKALHDPAWIALQIDGEVIEESICLFREQPFKHDQQVSCIASLCQDHPAKPFNRFNSIFDYLKLQHPECNQAQIASQWFERFLQISLVPLMGIYHCYGMAFESHQQNVLVELKEGWPEYLWLRDNQGFYYIEELAGEVLAEFPDLKHKAHAVGDQDFVDERFCYYFFGNTLFGLINAIAATGYIEEEQLLQQLQQQLQHLYQHYPDSSLLQLLLHSPTLPYKGNLLTRLYELDELTAPVQQQSIYIPLKNPLKMTVQEASYA